jgi:hypothetical protein
MNESRIENAPSKSSGPVQRRHRRERELPLLTAFTPSSLPSSHPTITSASIIATHSGREEVIGLDNGLPFICGAWSSVWVYPIILPHHTLRLLMRQCS